MLYRTHKRFGVMFGLGGVATTTVTQIVPSLSQGVTPIIVLTCFYMAMRGTSFGSEFPDCDSYGGEIKDENGNHKLDNQGNIMVSSGSIPAQKHPYISKIFRLFNVKHRGKFSHDYGVQTLFWLGIYLLWYLLYSSLFDLIVQGNTLIILGVNLAILTIVWMLSVDLIDLINIMGDMLKGNYKVKYSKATFEIDNVRLRKSVLLFLLLSAIMIFSKVISFDVFNISNALQTISLLGKSIKIYIIFTFFGVISHLFADMLTVSGVSFFGVRIQPMKYLDKIFPGKNFRTDSPWEKLCMIIVSILCIPLLYLALVAVI